MKESSVGLSSALELLAATRVVCLVSPESPSVNAASFFQHFLQSLLEFDLLYLTVNIPPPLGHTPGHLIFFIFSCQILLPRVQNAVQIPHM